MSTAQLRRALDEQAAELYSKHALVSIQEVGYQMGGATAETVVARITLGGHPQPVEDWQGRLAVPVELAAKLVGDFEHEVASAEAKRAGYEQYVREREERRRAAGADAAERAVDAAFEADRLQRQEEYAGFVGTIARGTSGRERNAAREARREALAEFDRKYPLKSLEEWGAES